MKRYGFTIVLFLIALLLYNCKKKENKQLASADRGDLVEVTANGSLSKSEIEERITEFPSQGWAIYDVSFYSITYRTEYMGKPIDSRGLLIIPNGIDTVDLLMYCHGTEIPSQTLGADNITPSLYTGSSKTHNDVRNMGLGWASKGFVVFLPDYIGFGLTIDKEHPYIYYPELFLSNIDGLLAVKKHLLKSNLSYDNQLFLTGWSQGGGACLSAHKYIQEQYASEFTVEASSGLAGLINFERFHDEILSLGDDDSDVMPILSWAVYAVNKFSVLKRPTDQIYSYPVYDQMSALLSPSKKPGKAFKPYFIKKVLNGEDKEYRNIIAQNSFSKGWLPVGKVFFHHGDADEVVPYSSSTDAETGLRAAGGDIKLYTYPGGKHTTELGNFIQNTFKDFSPLR